MFPNPQSVTLSIGKHWLIATKKKNLTLTHQEERARTHAAKLGKKVFVNNDVVMDDEKYFKLSNYYVPGNNKYYSENKTQAPLSIKYKKKVKFEPQVLVWVVMSSRGLSEIYVHTSKISVDQNIYIKNCLFEKKTTTIHQWAT